MPNGVLIFVAVIVVACVAGLLIRESLPDLIHNYQMRTSARIVRQLAKVEMPSWASYGRAQLNVYTSSDGVVGCTITASFDGEERFERSSISHCPSE